MAGQGEPVVKVLKDRREKNWQAFLPAQPIVKTLIALLSSDLFIYYSCTLYINHQITQLQQLMKFPMPKALKIYTKIQAWETSLAVVIV